MPDGNKAFEIKFRVQVDGKIKTEGATNVEDVVFEMFRGTPESGYLFVVKGHFRAPGPKIHMPN